MTSKERVEALFTHNIPDRIPIGYLDPGFSALNAGYSINDAYADPERSFYAQMWTAEQYGWEPIGQFFGHTILGAGDFGGKIRLPKSEYEQSIIVESFPVKNESDLLSLRLPDPKKAGRIPSVMAFSKLQADHGLPVWFLSRSPFSVAANICGVDQFLRWTMKKPELSHILMRLATDHIFNVLRYWVDTFGAENIFVFMSSPSESNQVISPKHFEKFALPYHVEYFEHLESIGNIKYFAFHICGEQNANLQYLAELTKWPHPSILSFGHEVDIDVAAGLFPEDIIFGNIDPTVIQTGTQEKVYERSRDAIQKGMKAPGGFILGPGCGLPPRAPPINVFAMTRAVNDFGWYE
jgi:uroporphyrinogen decarboxylase